MTGQRLRIPVSDGFRLAAMLYHPNVGSGTASGLVVINSATAVPQGFYAPFARFLGERGFVVLTYDYRGIGESRPPSLRRFKAEARQWGEIDADGIIRWAAARFGDLPLFLIGHSIGGVLLGLTPEATRAQRCVLVSPQNGYWRLFPSPQRQGWAILWYLLVPALTAVIGYFPARSLGFGEDLPAGVAREFSHWCRNPDYLVGGTRGVPTVGFSRLRAPILVFSAADDVAAPGRGVEKILELFDNASVEWRRLTPESLGVRSLGHFGFFRETHHDTLWRDVIDWCLNDTGGETRSS